MSNYHPHRQHQHPYPQQQLNGAPMLPHQQQQQPLLHQPPIVYGNYNMSSSSPQYAIYPYYHHYQSNMDLTNSSPISMASSTDEAPPRTPPTAINHNSSNKHLTHVPQGTTPSLMVNPLVPPPPPPPLSSSPLASSQLNSTEDRVKATIARANALPLEFYQTEFLEYSTQQPSGNRKRKRTTATDDEQETNQKHMQDQDAQLSNDEIRRQIHIQSEQKRRAQIKDGFEELKQHLPGCSHKKLSKAALLTRTVQQLEHMKKMQNELLAEVERLVKENSSLKKFAAADTHM